MKEVRLFSPGSDKNES
jgi:hypothetical protein